MLKIFKKKSVLIAIGVVVLVLVGLSILDHMKVRNLRDWDRAKFFILYYQNENKTAQWAARNHIPEPQVVPDQDLSFKNGAEILHYNSATRVLTIKTVNGDGYDKEEPKEDIENFMKAYNALFDPRIGGMFDQAGGYMTHSDDWSSLFLVKDYKVNELSVDEFMKQLDYQQRVNEAWFDSWGIAVAQIVHQGKPMPTQKVTLENNPYK